MAATNTVIQEDDMNVHDQGRFTVPADIRDEHMLAHRLIEFRLLDEDGDEYATFNRKVGSEGRVTIPKTIRDEHDIEDGDKVDIELHI